MRIEDERAMRVAYRDEFGVDMATGMHAHTWKAAWKAALRHTGTLSEENVVPALLRPINGGIKHGELLVFAAGSGSTKMEY